MSKCDNCPFEYNEDVCDKCVCPDMCVGCGFWNWGLQFCEADFCPYHD